MGVNGIEPVAQTLGLILKRVGVDAVCGGSRRKRLAVARFRGKQGGFSLGAHDFGHEQDTSRRRRARRACRVSVRLMPCRTVQGAREMDMHTLGNALHALGVHGACTTSLERGLRRDLWLVGAAGNDWAASTVARGHLWRGSNGWLAAEASVPTGVRTIDIGEREGEGEVQGFRWLASGVVGVLLGGSSSPIGGVRWRG
jgi:hypothetical protein